MDSDFYCFRTFRSRSFTIRTFCRFEYFDVGLSSFVLSSFGLFTQRPNLGQIFSLGNFLYQKFWRDLVTFCQITIPKSRFRRSKNSQYIFSSRQLSHLYFFQFLKKINLVPRKSKRFCMSQHYSSLFTLQSSLRA